MGGRTRVHFSTSAKQKRQSFLPLTVPLTAFFIISGVQGTICPNNVTKVAHGHTAIHNHVCYLFVNKEVYWDKARDACWDLGGEMLAIEDSNTVEFIKKTLDSSQLGWNRNGVWLGAREESGTWRWTNGKVMTYTNWANNQPKTFLGRTLLDCLQMRQEDGWKWRNSVCSLAKFHYNYICQFPLDKPVDAENRLFDDRTEDNGNLSILAIIIVTIVTLLLIIGTVFLVLSSNKRCSKQNGKDTTGSYSNNVHPSIRTTQPDYQTPSVSTDQTPFSSHDRLYMMPSEVVKPNTYLHTLDFLTKSCNCCHVGLQTGASNSACQPQNKFLALEAYSEHGPKQKPEMPLMASINKINNELARSSGTICECLYCCPDNQAGYVDMKKAKHAKEEDPKHIYNNVDYKDGGYVNHYEI